MQILEKPIKESEKQPQPRRRGRRNPQQNLRGSRQMDYSVTYEHVNLANGEWEKLTLVEQLGNIGSEISRALSAKRRNNPDRVQGAIFRALELFDLTIISCQTRKSPTALQEVCRAREEACDFFLGDNEFNTNPIELMQYYDQFALLARSGR